MKKIIFIIASFIPLISLAQNKPIISIDIGHYLSSQGTVSAYGDYEFGYNKAMGKVLAEQISSLGYPVNVIGYDGLSKDLKQRALLGNQGSIFVSIHHDAIQAQDLSSWLYKGKKLPFNDEVKGFGVFVSTKNPQFEQSLFCAKIVAQQLIKTGFTPNYYHNKNIPNENKKLFFNDLPVYQYDNLIVLKSSTVPAILIEAGVLTNRKEAQWIAQPEVRLAFAQTVAQSIDYCLKQKK